MLHWPSSLLPHATAWPSLLSSTVWRNPADTCVYVTPSVKRGMLHWPSSLLPQATTQPSLLNNTVWFVPVQLIHHRSRYQILYSRLDTKRYLGSNDTEDTA
eukprot:gnl/MRDRNA2_/MRDRNA2_222296_c0_seq1.p1 gnl/MRDRNA2_/MRDRNA2_222296_c0~~gnl/MRDRNA2_/MRDRNA2_222296_c0_seq1.p1  ORF type:complete len:101 (-),score=0.97 gnl/MRDRNA2_/MRDRNA2_222296_c0_seq1:96-398(-)